MGARPDDELNHRQIRQAWEGGNETLAIDTIWKSVKVLSSLRQGLTSWRRPPRSSRRGKTTSCRRYRPHRGCHSWKSNRPHRGDRCLGATVDSRSLHVAHTCPFFQSSPSSGYSTREPTTLPLHSRSRSGKNGACGRSSIRSHILGTWYILAGRPQIDAGCPPCQSTSLSLSRGTCLEQGARQLRSLQGLQLRW